MSRLGRHMNRREVSQSDGLRFYWVSAGNTSMERKGGERSGFHFRRTDLAASFELPGRLASY
jgi:hypothetical protein